MTGNVSELFVSPCCRSPLVPRDDSLECLSCNRSYSARGDVFRFTTGRSSHGEFSSAEMAELLALAQAQGWRAALDNYARPKRPRAVQMITDPRRRRSVESLAAVGGGRVLDFGCGYGGVSLALSEMFDEVVALDGSEDRVSFLGLVKRQENIGNIVPVCHIDAANLPFPDNHFDAAVLIGVLEYLPQGRTEDSPTQVQGKFLRELRRILRPGGRVLIHTKNRFGWQYWLGGRDHSGLRFAPVLPVPLADLILRKLQGRRYRIINYSLDGYKRLLKDAGLEVLGFEWPVPDYQVPDHMLSLDGDLPRELEKVDRTSFSPGKASALRALASVGLLRYVVPYYGITAEKPRSAITS